MIIPFKHAQAAHCENGATANILRYHGIDVSEAMVFGIGSGLFFIYMPLIKHNGIPISSFRPLPGMIFNRATKLLGVKIYRKKFRNKEASMAALEETLARRIPVGLQVGVFHLAYFPRPYRFHFNAHNLVVFGKENGRYLISDPVMENIESLSPEELVRVRWARGLFQPRGKMYYPIKIPPKIDLSSAIIKGIRKNCWEMLSIPGPFIGVRGIRYLARDIKKWPAKLGEKKGALYLGQFIRMQEEIGTGGAGFRFIYAAFLQEASRILNNGRLLELSHEMTICGDRWREFAVMAARIMKNRSGESDSYQELSEMLFEIADREKFIFTELRKAIS